MKAAQLVLRDLARRDVEDAVDHYLAEAGARVALRFIDALAAAYGAIRTSPAAGSPRYGHELDLPGLRTRRLAGFPYLVFYMEADGRAEIWRVLNTQQDIPARFQPPEDEAN